MGSDNWILCRLLELACLGLWSCFDEFHFWYVAIVLVSYITDKDFVGNTVVQMYAVTHPEFEAKAWHVFVAYIVATWIACSTVCLFNSAMPHMNSVGIFLILVGFFITVVVV